MTQLERQLGLCRALIEEFRTGVTADNLRELEIELQPKLAELSGRGPPKDKRGE